MATHITDRKRGGDGGRGAAAYGERAIAMLARYPDVSGAEADEIAAFLKGARYLEVEHIRRDDGLRHQIDLFVRHHGSALRPSATDVVSILALAVGFLAICWLLWQSLGAGAGS